MKKKVIYSGDYVTVRTKKKAHGKTGFYLDIYREGVRQYVFLKDLYCIEDGYRDSVPMDGRMVSIPEYNACIRKKIVQIAAEKDLEIRKYGIQKNSRKATEGTLSGLLQTRKERKMSEGKVSMARQLQNVITHLQASGCDVRLDRMDRQWCLDFLQSLKHHAKESTRHNYFLNVNASLNEAVADELLKENPFLHIPAKYKPHRQKARVEYLDPAEVKAMLDTEYRQDIKTFFKFLCYSGMRYSDAVRLKWEDLHEAGNRFVQIGFTAKKTGQEQSVYVPAEILPGEKPEGVIFKLPQSTTLNRHLKKWAALAGVKKNVHLHTARHTFATGAVTRGVDLYTVSKLLGHSSISTTQIYAEVVDRKKMEAARKMKGIF